MAETKTLLSQNEIDTLINFLENHNDTPIGKVLDQSSIDKLVGLIKFNNSKGVFFGKDVKLDDISAIKEKAGIADTDGKVVDISKFELVILTDADGNINVVCSSKDGSGTYPIYPECLTKGCYVPKGSAWGKAIAPSTLMEISQLFGIECSSETLEKAGKGFAKVVYGDENIKLPDYYAK